MPERKQLIQALALTADAWKDPDHPSRRRAVDETITNSDSFTEEATAYAVNQQMALLSEEALEAWPHAAMPRSPRTVGVLNPGNVPLVELQDFLAVVLSGHRYLGTVSSRSPALLQGFVRDVAKVATVLPAEFVKADQLFARSDAVIATGSDETAAWVADACETFDIPPQNRLIRGHRFSVAVIDGRESGDELEQLAEDALLHEGFGCRNVAVIWAPANLPPDEVLEAFARFRGVFPAHSSTPGRLKMQKAFLDAVQVPHGFGEGLEFLLSKGDPEPMKPGHVRWAEYGNLDDVAAWLAEHRAEIQVVAVRDELRTQLNGDIPLVALGETQRPPLDWCPDDVDVMAFLEGLS